MGARRERGEIENAEFPHLKPVRMGNKKYEHSPNLFDASLFRSSKKEKELKKKKNEKEI